MRIWILMKNSDLNHDGKILNRHLWSIDVLTLNCYADAMLINEFLIPKDSKYEIKGSGENNDVWTLFRANEWVFNTKSHPDMQSKDPEIKSTFIEKRRLDCKELIRTNFQWQLGSRYFKTPKYAFSSTRAKIDTFCKIGVWTLSAHLWSIFVLENNFLGLKYPYINYFKVK